MTIYKNTKHSIERSKERKHLNEKRAKRDAWLAWTRGKDFSYFTSLEHEYLLDRTDGGIIGIAYAGFCYIFSIDGTCITLYELPEWFNNKLFFKGKEQIKNVKKFARYNPTSQEEWQEYAL